MQRDKLIQALSDSKAVGELIGIGFDFGVEQPLERWIQPKDLLNHFIRFFDLEQAGQLFERHLPDMIERATQRAQESQESLKDWVTAELDAELRSWAIRPLQLNPHQLKRWVHHEAIEYVMRELVREILERFIQAAKPGGSGGGLLGMASRGALGWASRASKGVLSGVSDQIESHLKSIVSGFIQSSMQSFLERLTLILSTPEAAQKLGIARLELYEDLLQRPLADLISQAQRGQRTQWREWIQLFPELIDHHLNRPAVREALLQEAEAILQVEGARSLKTFLGDDTRREELKQEVQRTLTPHLIEWADSKEFKEWVDRYC